MSSPSPLYDEVLPFRAAALEGLAVKAAIDRGCTLTKVIFLPRGSSPDSGFLPLRCLTFLNSNFEQALTMMRQEAELPSSGILHVTGVGCALFKARIKAVLGLDLLFIQESISVFRGNFHAVKNVRGEDLFHPQPAFKSWIYESNFLKDTYARTEGEEEGNERDFPSGSLNVGSGTGMFIMDDKGLTKMAGFTGFCGKSFMGMAQLMLGTRDYAEVMRLAAAGDRLRVDYQVKDFIESDGTPYGSLPADMPVFAFGKAADDKWGDKVPSREDLAASLVGFMAGGLVLNMLGVCLTTGVKKFFVGGNFTRSELVRSIMLEASTVVKGDLDIRFLRNGHIGAIGTMLCTEEDTIEKWVVNKLDL